MAESTQNFYESAYHLDMYCSVVAFFSILLSPFCKCSLNSEHAREMASLFDVLAERTLFAANRH